MGAGIRFIDQVEANRLAELVRRKSLSARSGGPNNFYYQRLRGLANQTVVEVFRRGHPDAIFQYAQRLADIFETTVLLSSSLDLSRTQFQKHLAITPYRQYGYSFIIGPNFRALRSKESAQGSANGIAVSHGFVDRFQRFNFSTLVQFCIRDNEMAERVCSALPWLLESRLETNLGAAIVKTAIALESLLIFNDSEPLSRSLSERCAFMLSQDPNERAMVSKLVRDFYHCRSRSVHIGSRKADLVSPALLESIDRLTLFVCLQLSVNQDKWTSRDSLREWCESQRWGAPDNTIILSYPNKYFKAALKLGLSS